MIFFIILTLGLWGIVILWYWTMPEEHRNALMGKKNDT
jgi:hypothetical protein